MTPEQREAFRHGYLFELIKNIREVKDGSSVAGQLDKPVMQTVRFEPRRVEHNLDARAPDQRRCTDLIQSGPLPVINMFEQPIHMR